MVRVGDDEREAQLRRDGVHQVEQRHRIGAAGHRHERGPGLGEEPGADHMLAEALQQRSHV